MLLSARPAAPLLCLLLMQSPVVRIAVRVLGGEALAAVGADDNLHVVDPVGDSVPAGS